VTANDDAVIDITEVHILCNKLYYVWITSSHFKIRTNFFMAPTFKNPVYVIIIVFLHIIIFKWV